MTAQFCRDCTVLQGEPHSMSHNQPPLGDGIYTKPFGRRCHDNQDVYMTTAGCCNGHYLH